MGKAQRNPRDTLDAQAALESWLKVSRALVEDLSLPEVLDVIAQVARDLAGYPYAMVALADETAERLIVQGAAGLPPEYLAFTNVESPLLVGGAAGEAETPSARAFRTGEPVALLDLLADEALEGWRAVADQQGWRALLSLPLAGPGELGALTVYSATPGEFDQGQIDLLSALAKGAAAAIEIARLREREAAMMTELEDVDLMHQRLNRVALTGDGLVPILRSLSEMTGYSMSVEEYPSGATMAACPRGKGAPLLEAHRAEALRASARDKMDSVSESFGDQHFYVSPVVIGGDVAALLWASGTGPAMTTTQRRVFERGALVSSLELHKQRHAQEVEWRLRGDLLRDLLTLEPAGASLIIERARDYGLDLAKPHVVLVVGIDTSPQDDSPGEARLQRTTSAVRSEASRGVAASLVADRDGQVVVLVPHDEHRTDDVRRLASRITAAVAARGGNRFTASVAVGEICRAPLDYRSASQVASTALRLFQDGGARGGVVDVSDLGIFRLLLSAHEPQVLRDFAERTLAPLRQSQDARSADLVATLRAYLENDMQPGRTAKALHVHVNTLAYRLGRIESLTGTSLRGSQGLLDVGLALAIDRLLQGQG